MASNAEKNFHWMTSSWKSTKISYQMGHATQHVIQIYHAESLWCNSEVKSKPCYWSSSIFGIRNIKLERDNLLVNFLCTLHRHLCTSGGTSVQCSRVPTVRVDIKRNATGGCDLHLRASMDFPECPTAFIDANTLVAECKYTWFR